MSECPFCNAGKTENSPEAKRPGSFLVRAWRRIQWVFPTALLVLMPKCPLCVAAYIALFTGVGISVSTARWIQVLMIVLCVGSLSYLLIRYGRWLSELLRSRRAGNPKPERA
jgi:hypothetical protein